MSSKPQTAEYTASILSSTTTSYDTSCNQSTITLVASSAPCSKSEDKDGKIPSEASSGDNKSRNTQKTESEHEKLPYPLVPTMTFC